MERKRQSGKDIVEEKQKYKDKGAETERRSRGETEEWTWERRREGH
jgi:hypothetical protein